MGRTAVVAGVVVMLLTCVGCAFYDAPVVPPNALVFTNLKAPVSTEFDDSASVATKKGTASVTSVMGLVAFGDASLEAAAEDGGLRTIDYLDYEYLNVLFGLYSNFTIVAHGH